MASLGELCPLIGWQAIESQPYQPASQQGTIIRTMVIITMGICEIHDNNICVAQQTNSSAFVALQVQGIHLITTGVDLLSTTTCWCWSLEYREGKCFVDKNQELGGANSFRRHHCHLLPEQKIKAMDLCIHAFHDRYVLSMKCCKRSDIHCQRIVGGWRLS